MKLGKLGLHISTAPIYATISWNDALLFEYDGRSKRNEALFNKIEAGIFSKATEYKNSFASPNLINLGTFILDHVYNNEPDNALPVDLKKDFLKSNPRSDEDIIIFFMDAFTQKIKNTHSEENNPKALMDELGILRAYIYELIGGTDTKTTPNLTLHNQQPTPQNTKY